MPRTLQSKIAGFVLKLIILENESGCLKISGKEDPLTRNWIY